MRWTGPCAIIATFGIYCAGVSDVKGQCEKPANSAITAVDGVFPMRRLPNDKVTSRVVSAWGRRLTAGLVGCADGGGDADCLDCVGHVVGADYVSALENGGYGAG